MRDEVLDADAKAKAKLYDGTKTFPTNFNEKKTNCEVQIFMFYLHFY